ncbi:MAG: 2-oxoglutarate dehydrogenase E1 component, partial [Acidobacteria bacterium]
MSKREQQIELEEASDTGATGTAAHQAGRGRAGSEAALDAFRRWGYLQASVDPMGLMKPLPHPELDAIPETEARHGRSWYCGSIGAEFMHIPDPERRAWVQERMEQAEPPIDEWFVLERLARAEIFEEVLHGRYLGTKRFSIEGVAGVIPFLDETLESGAARGMEEVLIAMSHRGRLTVMVHVVGRSPVELFACFEDLDPKSVLGSGDVKYHLGATGWYTTRQGRKVRVKLVSNPSHLEAVDPVVEGRARARQVRIGEEGNKKVVPVVLHGDAAFAGQGILAEVLNYSELPGYAIGGTIHLVVNNQIGFTTSPHDLHATRFPTALARRLPI